MSNMWPDEDVETTSLFGDQESAEEYLNGDAEAFDEEGNEDSEATSAAVRRRRQERDLRVRRLAMLRRQEQAQRAARARARVSTPRAAVRTTQAAVRTLDLKNQVQADEHKRALAAEGKRTSRAEMATVAGAVISQFVSTFEDRLGFLKNPEAKAVASFAPLLFLSPAKHGSGFGAYARDPRVFGGAAIAAILAAHKLTEKPPPPPPPPPPAVQRVDVTPASLTLAAKATTQLIADAFDDSNKRFATTEFEWKTTNSKVATVAVVDGTNTAIAEVTVPNSATTGQTAVITVTATASGVDRQVPLTVA